MPALSLRRALAAAAVLCASAGAASGRERITVDVPATVTAIGAEVEFRLDLHTDGPLSVIGARAETIPSFLRLVDWSFGEAFLRHIALHGEPPICDIIIYPDGSRLFAVMAFAEPFDSAEYGSEWLVLRYQVTAAKPVSTCIMVQGDTPDYEPGDDLLSLLSQLSSAGGRRCAPVSILGALPMARGDVDNDADRDLGDAVSLLRRLFRGERAGACPDAADVNDDGSVNLSDPVYLLGVLFLGQEFRHWRCAPDASGDALPPCAESSC